MIDKQEYDLILKSLDPVADSDSVDQDALTSLLDQPAGFDRGFADETASIAMGIGSVPLVVKRRLPFARFAVAAAIVILVGLVGFLAIQRNTYTQPTQVAIRTQVLPDGSSVDLAPGSRLVVDTPFSDSRTVRLTGEAYFSVETSDIPFIVELEHGRVTVTGTEFNVRSWPTELAFAEVTLFEGAVQIESGQNADLSEPVHLLPGQSIRLSANGATRAADASAEHATAWRAGGFGFSEVSVSFAFREVERRYGITITVAENVDVSRRVTYLSPRQQTLDGIMTDLCHALSLQYRSTREGYEVYTTN